MPVVILDKFGGIRGARASASLKVESASPSRFVCRRIRGARASASLKVHEHGWDQRVGRRASEAHAPRPH